MLTLTFGKISKRPNSTKNAMSNTMDVYATLKENVSVEAPIFKINFDPRAYNYVAWAGDNFTRYYYIKEHVCLANNLWEVHCELDRKATYRSLYMYGVSGHCVYSTDDSYWDQYFDDMRFTPENLDTWTHASELFPDMTYLYEVDNIFGHDIDGPNLWDITWTQNDDTHEYYLSSIGEGCYVVQVRNTMSGTAKGMYTFLMNKNIFQQFSHFELLDFSKYIVSAIWLPLNMASLVSLIPASGKDPTDIIPCGPEPYTYSGAGAGGELYAIANPCVLSFSGSLDFPKDNVSHPLFMENNRWNTMQLNTPGGTTQLNLDLCYPCSGRKLNFSTFLDVVSGTTDTKFTYDIKGTAFDNVAGTTAYASSYTIGFDVLGLVTAQKSPLAPLIDIGGSVAPIAATAMGGPVVGMTVGTLATGIKQATQVSPNGKEFNIGAAIANLFNNSQPGAVTLRMKPWRCRELSEGDWPYQAYLNYCDIHGYPVNKYLDWHDITTNLGKYWVFDEVYVDPNGLTSNPIYTEGLTPDILNAIIADFKSGIWLE